MLTPLEFEKPIAELENQIEDLRRLADEGLAGDESDIDIEEEVGRLQAKADRLLQTAYARLTPWQKTQVARHPNRPHFLDYVAGLVEDWTPMAGDRGFADDQAILGGLCRFRGRTIMLIGHEKGASTTDRLRHNFGMARPEGYRKAQRLMRLAERFKVPVVTLVDTAGAYPGIDAEARGQAEAIARSTETCLDIRVPLISVVIGEGGSGGAIALAAANVVMMLEHSIYSVISPEGCASILWRSGDMAKDAAEALKLTAQDLLQLGVIDQIVPEPLGGAHRNRAETVQTVGGALELALSKLQRTEGASLRIARRDKFLEMGRHGLS